MKTLKKGVVLLALFLAGMTIIPCVNAGDAQMATAITDKEVQEIFNSASVSETLPSSMSSQAESSYLEQYVSPARKAIDLMKSQHYNDDQITAMLKKNGYGWDSSTGACWKGHDPTPEEQNIINKIRGPGYSPFPESPNNSRQFVNMITSLRGAGATMNLVDENTYFGINYDMTPGDMVISSSGTYQHVVTAHAGKTKPNGQDDWTEAGVARSIVDPTRQYFTFDNDEGQWKFHGTAGSTSSTTYQDLCNKYL